MSGNSLRNGSALPMRKLDRRSVERVSPAVRRTSSVWPSVGLRTAARRPQARWVRSSKVSGGRSGNPNVPGFVR